MRPHSIKAVFEVLKIISSVELPFLDLIFSTKTKPIVLCCGHNTTNSLNPKSDLWKVLLCQLSDNSKNAIGCNLKDMLQFVF